MAINNGSNIRVETNINGRSIDNDEWIATKTYIEHHSNDTASDEIALKALQDLYAPPSRVAKDKRISKANSKDLKDRSISNTNDPNP